MKSKAISLVNYPVLALFIICLFNYSWQVSAKKNVTKPEDPSTPDPSPA